jgi:hypothetical protein
MLFIKLIDLMILVLLLNLFIYLDFNVSIKPVELIINLLIFFPRKKTTTSIKKKEVTFKRNHSAYKYCFIDSYQYFLVSKQERVLKQKFHKSFPLSSSHGAHATSA